MQRRATFIFSALFVYVDFTEAAKTRSATNYGYEAGDNAFVDQGMPEQQQPEQPQQPQQPEYAYAQAQQPVQQPVQGEYYKQPVENFVQDQIDSTNDLQRFAQPMQQEAMQQQQQQQQQQQMQQPMQQEAMQQEPQPMQQQQQLPQQAPAQPRQQEQTNFLSMQSQSGCMGGGCEEQASARKRSTSGTGAPRGDMMNQLTEAIERQSQALVALEGEQHQLARLQTDFATRSLELFERLAKEPHCNDIKKPGKVEDQGSCEKACKEAGHDDGDWIGNGMWPVGRTYRCECEKGSDDSTICSNLSARMANPLFWILGLAMMRVQI